MNWPGPKFLTSNSVTESKHYFQSTLFSIRFLVLGKTSNERNRGGIKAEAIWDDSIVSFTEFMICEESSKNISVNKKKKK